MFQFINHSVGRVLVSACLLTSSVIQAHESPTSPDTEPGASRLDQVQVTATRFPEPIQEVPESIELITSDELRARGVTDLREALALLGGITVAPGGDEGPGGAVPGLLGLREVDDFVLVVDGVPVGGAFIPQFSTLDFNNIERIEVQRGPASVFYGTTAFAGTINIVHYPAGQADGLASVSYGSYGSGTVGGSAVLSEGAIRQSLSANGTRDRYSDSRAELERAHLLYRLGGELEDGDARLDVDATLQHQNPASPRPLVDGVFAADVPIDFNQNPADSKFNTHRILLVAGYDKSTRFGAWGSTLSFNRTHIRQVRGFINAEDGGVPDGSGNFDATGFSQRRELSELFLDSHLTYCFGPQFITTVGINELLGFTHQHTGKFSYSLPADGSRPPSSSDGTFEEGFNLSDVRNFSGVYTQSRWNLTTQLGLLAGLRLNHTNELRTTNDTFTQEDNNTRLSGSLGLNWRIWQDAEADLDDVVTYFNYGNTFQPPQIDFGPENQGSPLLKPETAQSLQFGIKADGLDGRFSADLATFLVNFRNQPVVMQLGGVPKLTNGGEERFIGVELEMAYRLVQPLSITANISYNDARYLNFNTQIDGETIQLHGKRVRLSPPVLAAIGLIYGQSTGIKASLTVNFVGRRALDFKNTVTSPAYSTLDATFGYQFPEFEILLSGSNLSDRRDPVLASELGEGQFYLLPGRRLFVKLELPL